MTPATLEKKLSVLFKRAIAAKVFPGGVAGITVGSPGNRTEIILPYGHLGFSQANEPIGTVDFLQDVEPETFFDLASLTKPLATVLSILCLIKSQKIQLTDKLEDLLNEDMAAPLKSISLANLLGHNSGLPAHRPYFKDLMKMPPNDRIRALKQRILHEKLESPVGSQATYSDLGFIVLGWIVENQANCRLDKFVREKIMAPLGLEENIFFNHVDDDNSKIYAPTEKCSWRHKILAGQVHDDNCYAIGGIAGHAGLFGNMLAVLKLCTELLDNWQGRSSHPNFDRSNLLLATRRQIHMGTTWGLGFDTPSANGSSGGGHLSRQSFGHLGFTGTSFWIDPSRDIVMVLLTNRVHPRRNNDQIKSFRPLFHDTIMEWAMNS